MIPAWRPTLPATQATAPTPRSRAVRGFSLTEMIVVIAVLGALAGIAVSKYTGITEVAREAVAREKMEMLNQGVNNFSQSLSPLALTPMAGQTDEMLILGYLHWRDPVDPVPGTPFIDQRYQPIASSSTEDYRIQWTTNSLFKLLKPGETGTGLQVPLDGSDYKTALAVGVNPQNRGL